MSLTPIEISNKKKLRQGQLFATGLLILAIIGYFLAAKYAKFSPNLLYLKAFCEAAMVGALADWFAVVALFRHPLGLPIPHTAILPHNQQKIAMQIGIFIENNFLQGSVISKKIYTYQPSQMLMKWLQVTENREKLLTVLSQQSENLINYVQPKMVQDFIINTSNKKLTGDKIGHYLALLLTSLHQNHYDTKLLNTITKQLIAWLEEPGTRKKIEISINSWVKKVENEVSSSTWQKLLNSIKGGTIDIIDDWLAKKILEWIEQYCHDILEQPNHMIRNSFQQKWLELIVNLDSSKELQQKIETYSKALINSTNTRSFIEDNWLQLQNWSNTHPIEIQQHLDKLLSYLLEDILSKPNYLRKIDLTLTILVKELVNQYKNTVAIYIENRIQEWDSKKLVQKLETSVGKDLQFIRINGTLVGGLVGLLIYLLSGILTSYGLI